jgi:hypothetical protein
MTAGRSAVGADTGVESIHGDWFVLFVTDDGTHSIPASSIAGTAPPVA